MLGTVLLSDSGDMTQFLRTLDLYPLGFMAGVTTDLST